MTKTVLSMVNISSAKQNACNKSFEIEYFDFLEQERSCIIYPYMFLILIISKAYI